MQITSATFVKGIKGTDPITDDGRPEIAFIGRSNVGKSSLINSLLGQKSLAKTGKKPGKTTEINFFSINQGRLYFVDLPGYGYAKVNPQQKEKIKRLILWYLMEPGIPRAVVVLVLDIKAGFTEFDAQTVALLQQEQQPYLIVANKSDKLNQRDAATQVEKIKELSGSSEVFLYSSLNKKETGALLQKLASFL